MINSIISSTKGTQPVYKYNLKKDASQYLIKRS